MKTAALVLASGLSKRFGSEDKLLADLKGQALLAYSLDTARETGFDGLFVICPDPDPRADIARSFGFDVIPNPSPEAGQGATIALGAKHCLSAGFDAVCILLGDMPFVTSDYIRELTQSTGDIVFSRSGTHHQPPAIFRGPAIKTLTQLSGDNGAKALELSNFHVEYINLPDEMARDFDLPSDFDLSIKQ